MLSPTAVGAAFRSTSVRTASNFLIAVARPRATRCQSIKCSHRRHTAHSPHCGECGHFAFRIGWLWLCLATASRESSLRSRARRGRGKSTILLVRTATYSSEKTNITPSESRMRAYRAVQLYVYGGAEPGYSPFPTLCGDVSTSTQTHALLDPLLCFTTHYHALLDPLAMPLTIDYQ